ncbi:hypothetical protein SAMN04488523_110201 [Sulfitobacter brevis]|uniref:DUF6473 domain-containing protein n=1 Tax=Sulfitobacter brevis TaxID=74348 RepID=A0A1I2DM64_9RHOB|nr:DUF6473 family protein [Sulfitobacter brevis]SFE81391.1 hypothetical protein SAMN04488523_110201 [Sulfitobacter brevis]
MTYDVLGPGGLDYLPCRYGASKLLFRGPLRELTEPYIAFIGGTETYGKFIRTPFPALIEDQLGRTAVNFGVPNAGIDVFTLEPTVLNATADAQVTVVQVMGAQNNSNRYYSVHPRRNDRFTSASNILKAIYPEVDFADFHFTRHLINRLANVSPGRFVKVRAELQTAWVARMSQLLNSIRGPTILLWFADHPPLVEADVLHNALRHDPLFVTREMLDRVAVHASELVEVVCSAEAANAGTAGMVFSDLEEPAAQHMKGPAAHAEVQRALVEAIEGLV